MIFMHVFECVFSARQRKLKEEKKHKEVNSFTTEQKYPQLCHTCLRQSCHTEDPYAGSGALQCLLDHAADAAYVTDVDLKKARATVSTVSRV